MKPIKTVYYSDPLRDDFAGTNIRQKPVDGSFPFARSSPLYNFASALLYFSLMPVVFLIGKLYLGVKFENRQALRALRKTGFYLYGNHTRDLDAFLPALAAFPKRAHIIANPDAVSLPLLKNVVMMLGCIPVPNALSGMRPFMKAVSLRVSQKRCVAIFPEAHVWPFYTGLRPFPDTSFAYPAKDGVPAVAMFVSYRKRRGLFSLSRKPGMTVTFSEPFFPDPSLTRREAQKALRNQVYSFMDHLSKTKKSVVYIDYRPKPQDEPSIQKEPI